MCCFVLFCFACRHGIRQLRTGWADGPGYVTQCPLQTGMSYVYNFTITGQRGTLWWHAHISWLRASVHGAIIIYPKPHVPYPFPKPHKEVPIILGKGLYPESFYSLFYGWYRPCNYGKMEFNITFTFTLQENGGMQIPRRLSIRLSKQEAAQMCRMPTL